MKKVEEERLIDYFDLSKDDLINGKKFKVPIDCSECKKSFFENLFETKIPCKYYSMVINGEGGEDKKIDSFCSSSLQSLLFFCNVSSENPLVYNGVTYDKVYFEWENKVITLPSSIDVVLVGNDNKTILFIESKLFEVLRDSRKEGSKEIGKSYFISSDGYKKLKLNDDDYDAIGIKKENDGKGKINPIGENEWVYSYGIKQMLSHVIGIKNFIDEGYKNNLNSYNLIEEKPNEKINIKFLTLINEMPCKDGINIMEEVSNEVATNCFIKHYNKVVELLNEKEEIRKSIDIYKCETYQKFYNEEIDDKYRDSISKKIVKHYHLNKQ